MTEIRIKKNDFGAQISQMIDKAKGAQGGFARIYLMYQKFQVERFQSENASEGATWASLTPKYSDYKRRRFGGGPKRGGGDWKSYPGAGSKVMIATGTLAGAVIGPGSPFGSEHHRALFTNNSMQISVEMGGNNAEGRPFDYAEHAAESRPFMNFSDKHVSAMGDELAKFILGF